MQTHHLLLGDGIDPAQKRGRYHSGSDEFSPAGRSHRPAGSGTVSGARPFQRARRSHDGDLGADERHVHVKNLAANFNLLRRKNTDATRSKRSSRCTTGEFAFSSEWAAIFLAASPDTEYTARALQSCRLTAHVSTKLNRSHLITGEIALILPCLGRSEIDRQESGEQFVTVEDSMGIINPSRGHARARERTSAERTGDYCRAGEGDVGESHDRRLGRFGRGLRSHSRSHRACHSRVRRFQQANSRTMSSICRMPHVTNAKFKNKEGKAKFTVSRFTAARTWARAIFDDDGSQPRSV